VRVAIAADHAGYLLKEDLREFLESEGHEVLDCGTDSTEPVDYPQFSAAAAKAVIDGRADRGIVLGGSGQGEQIAANKVHGIRASLCNDLYTARLARQHNDANALSLGQRVIELETALKIVKIWLETAFEGGRHERRVQQLNALG